MGGTSYDVCLIRDGRPDIKMDWNWFHRYCIGLPMIDIPSVGAGGGSIAWEEGGILHVGPQSAQSEAGPGLLPARRHRSPPSPTRTWCSADSTPRVSTTAGWRSISMVPALR